MQLKSLTYTSLASLDLTEDDILDLHRRATETNALDGITGVLIFNGTHFLQIIEGTPQAIDDLMSRMRRDPRHRGVEVRDERAIDERAFGDWSMELVWVESRYFEAREQLRASLPPDLPEAVRDRIYKMTQAISGPVQLSN